MDTKKILYYDTEYDEYYEGNTLYLTTKDYYDAHGCGWDQQFDVSEEPDWLAEYPMGPQLWQDLKKIGLDYEIMESMVLMRDFKTDSKLSIQEVKDRMKELGWTLLPFPEED